MKKKQAKNEKTPTITILSEEKELAIQVGDIYNLDDFGRVEVLAVEDEDIIVLMDNKKEGLIWMKEFKRGERLKIAGKN